MKTIADDSQSKLTKREYFAAMAMQGLVRMDLSISESKIAELSVMQADALIKQLNKQQEK